MGQKSQKVKWDSGKGGSKFEQWEIKGEIKKSAKYLFSALFLYFVALSFILFFCIQ